MHAAVVALLLCLALAAPVAQPPSPHLHLTEDTPTAPQSPSAADDEAAMLQIIARHIVHVRVF